MRPPAQLACALCDQRGSGLPAGLEPEYLPALERGKTVQWVRAGQTLFCEGGPCHSIHCVRSGVIKLFKVGLGGEPLVLRFCGPGTTLGLRSALAGESHEDTAEAVEDSLVCTFPREILEDGVAHSPTMALALMRQMAIEVREAHERMLELAHCGVMQRAAHLLLVLHELPDRTGAATGNGGSHLKRMDMAAMIGTSPESMSRVLRLLRERRIVAVGRDGVRVLDVARLRTIVRMPVEHEPI